MPNKYTEAEKEFIKREYPLHGTEWVAEKLGKRPTQIKAFASNNKLKRQNFYFDENAGKFIIENAHLSFEELSELTGESISRIQNFVYRRNLRPCDYEHFSPEDDKFLRENYHVLSNIEMGSEIGRSKWSVKERLRLLGLKRNNEQRLAINGRLSSGTWFTKGHLPKNTKADGSISVRVDSHGNPYQYIRISLGKWDLLHRVNWIAKNGPVPDDKILRAKDGNSLNVEPENWELIDRAGHLSKNAGRDELTDAYVAARLTHLKPELKETFLQMPELIELKRNQIKLKRTINELTETPKND